MRWQAYYGLVALGYLLALYWAAAAQPTSATTWYRTALPMVITNASTPSVSTVAQQVAGLVNQRRREHGCSAVDLSLELSNAAKRHSSDMASNNFFSHIGSDGSTFGERAKAARYLHWPSGEVLAAGYNDPSAVVNGWMKSDGHRKIILTCANNDIGVSLQVNPASQYHNYWTAVFGQR